MQTHPVISYRNLDGSDAIDALVHKRIDALEKRYPRMVGCDVTIEAPQKRQVSGRIIRVRLNVHVPGPDVSTEGTASQGSAQDDVKMAINRAFGAAEKALKKHKKVMNAVEVKHHAPQVQGVVSSLEPELGYGYVTANGGREVYFQRDSLTSDDWDRLRTGTRLRFREMEGEKGPYAVSVTLM